MTGEMVFWYLVGAALIVVPFWKLLPKNDIPSAWALIAVVPVGAILLLWILAFRDRFADRKG